MSGRAIYGVKVQLMLFNKIPRCDMSLSLGFYTRRRRENREDRKCINFEHSSIEKHFSIEKCSKSTLISVGIFLQWSHKKWSLNNELNSHSRLSPSPKRIQTKWLIPFFRYSFWERNAQDREPHCSIQVESSQNVFQMRSHKRPYRPKRPTCSLCTFEITLSWCSCSCCSKLLLATLLQSTGIQDL